MNILCTLMIVAAGVQPVGEPEQVTWGKKNVAYALGAEGVTFAVEGPGDVVVEVFAKGVKKNSEVTVDLLRNDGGLSTNVLTMKKARGPKGYGVSVRLGFTAPEGAQRYTITTSAEGEVAVAVSAVKKMPRRMTMAAAESPVEKPAEVAAAEQPEEGTEDVSGALAKVEQSAELAKLPDATQAVNKVAAEGLQKAKRVAVYDFELQGIEANIGAVVTDSVLVEMRKLQGISAIGMDEIRDMLSHEANKQILGCEENESCLAEIAGALGVDELVTGQLTKAADGHVIVVRRIDQNRAKVTGVYNKRLKAGSGQEFLAAIGEAIEELYPERALREGSRRGVAKEVAMRLDPPPLPPWAFYGVSGLAVIGAGAGGVFGLLAKSAETSYNTLANQGLTGRISGSRLTEIGQGAKDKAMVANIAYSAAGGLALTAIIMYLFTDFEGYGDSRP